MIFKTTTIIALAVGLMPAAQAAVMNADSKLDVRQHEECPVNGFACGWFLLEPRMCTTPDVLYDLRPNMTTDIWNSIWQITDGKPVAHVEECRGGCSNKGNGVPDTICNENRPPFA